MIYFKISINISKYILSNLQILIEYYDGQISNGTKLALLAWLSK
jgi:hypothetical protein